MHNDKPYFPGKPMQPLADRLGYYMQHAPMGSVFNGGIVPPFVKPLMPFHSVDIQPSDACPRNFVIFDQTTNRSQIRFHPEISSKFFYPGFGVDTTFQDNIDQKDANDEMKTASPLKEDSDDIDTLLSTEDDETEERDDDEVRTARTDAMYGCNSPDTCSNYGRYQERVAHVSGSLLGIIIMTRSIRE